MTRINGLPRATESIVPTAALEWVATGDTGMSSMAIWSHMMGLQTGKHPFHPMDPGDLGRCLRLLAKVPEWAARMGEMQQYGPHWAALAANWQELADTLADEAGIEFINGGQWPRGRMAHRTYGLMKHLLHGPVLGTHVDVKA